MKASWLPRAIALSLGVSAVACGYDPCADKNCGDPCRICEEGDTECVEPPGDKACNSNDVCALANPPMCN